MNGNNKLPNIYSTDIDDGKDSSNSGFDIRSFNSYKVEPGTQAAPAPTHVKSTEAMSGFNATQGPAGAYYTPQPSPSQAPTDSFSHLSEEEKQKQFKKAARRRFSYLAFSIVGMYFIYYFVALIAMSVYMAVTGEAEIPTTASMIIGTLSLALVGFPLLFLILLPKKSCPFSEKTKISFPKLLGLLTTTFTAMYTGAFIGSAFTSVLGLLLGRSPEPIVSSGLEGVPVVVVIIFTCVFPGIFEELIFRKLLIDKSREFGSFGAIVFSSLAFGIFHGNFEQFFYATFIGFLFGYIYSKTGKIIYTIILHATMNFFGSALVLLIENNEILMMIYSAIIFILWIIGVIVLVCEIVDNYEKFKLDRGVEAVGGAKIVLSAFVNPGAIVFFIVFAFEFVLVTLQTFGYLI